jgi:predicted methyltransferase
MDFALAFWMVHEVPDTPNFLREVFEALKPGGVFYVIEPWIHTSREEFGRILEEATRIGFLVLDRPRVFFSRAAVLSRPSQAGP